MQLKKIIAVVDPMCSWCYGFEPELKKLINYLKKENKLEVELLVGGLRGAGDKPWNDEFKNFLRQNWQRVAEVSGQKFGLKLFEKENFDYTTEPSCRAIVSVRMITGTDTLETFDAFSQLQQAFYLDSKDITNPEVIADVICRSKEDRNNALTNQSIDREDFLQFFHSNQAIEATQKDYQKSRQMGIHSFPSIIFIDSNHRGQVINGYHRFESLKNFLSA